MLLNSLLSRLLLTATVSVLSACAMNTNTTSASNTATTDSSATASSAANTLSAYHWDLTDARDAKGTVQTNWVPPKTRADAPLRLTFMDRLVVVSGLCNNMRAGYDLDGDKIKISGAASTMMACNDNGLMQYERAVGEQLPQASAWQITENPSGPVLTLRFADDSQWTLTGTPTDETRFGGTGEIQFLEVASQRVACSHPLIPNMQCLNVREIKYNDSGIQTSQGEWQAFYGEIEGYTHQPGVSNILRVKRYTRANVPADASSHAYVLDMVVQSAKE